MRAGKRSVKAVILLFACAMAIGILPVAPGNWPIRSLLVLWAFVRIILIAFAVYFIFYFPLLYFIRRRWNTKKKRSGDSERSRATGRFLANTNAMLGMITLVYAVLIFLAGHLLAPDHSPYANQQINELSFRPPGFSIQVLKQALPVQPAKQNFLHTLIFGRKPAYNYIPLLDFRIQGDSLYIHRFIGDNVPGQAMQFSLASITGKPNSAAENAKLVRSTFIQHKFFVFGTDDLGRDYLSRILIGVRVSLSVGFIAVCIALLIGIPAGAVAGYYRKTPPAWKVRRHVLMRFPVDDLIMWGINVIWAVPTLLLVFPIIFAFGQSFYTIFIAVGLTMWVDIARIVRGQVMQVRELEYVQAARSAGFSNARIIFRHILPNITGPVIVITAANFAYAILTEAGLSFLGIGVQPPAPSWGLMLSKYKDNLVTDPYLALIPGAAITLLVLAFFMIGNGLRDALDVKSGISR